MDYLQPCVHSSTSTNQNWKTKLKHTKILMPLNEIANNHRTDKLASQDSPSLLCLFYL